MVSVIRGRSGLPAGVKGVTASSNLHTSTIRPSQSGQLVARAKLESMGGSRLYPPGPDGMFLVLPVSFTSKKGHIAPFFPARGVLFAAAGFEVLLQLLNPLAIDSPVGVAEPRGGAYVGNVVVLLQFQIVDKTHHLADVFEAYVLRLVDCNAVVADGFGRFDQAGPVLGFAQGNRLDLVAGVGGLAAETVWAARAIGKTLGGCGAGAGAQQQRGTDGQQGAGVREVVGHLWVTFVVVAGPAPQ